MPPETWSTPNDYNEKRSPCSTTTNGGHNSPIPSRHSPASPPPTSPPWSAHDSPAPPAHCATASDTSSDSPTNNSSSPPTSRPHRAALGDDAFDTAFAEGRALDDDAALAYATRARGERPRRTIGWESLTPTEQEVLNLTAEGLSNKEIGGRLLMSPETVKTHLSHIYDKTGVRTRTALAREATLRATDRSSATEHQQDTGRVSGT